MAKAIRTLVIEENSNGHGKRTELLRSQGYEVRVASTGSDGLRLAREMRPELVLLDGRLPDISGVEVCRQLKSDESLSGVFVILFIDDLSAVDQLDDS